MLPSTNAELRLYRVRMTEPPRPPGDGNPYSDNDPTPDPAPPPSYGAPQPPPPAPDAGGYGPPPSSGPPGYGPPPGGFGPPPGGQQFGGPPPGGQQFGGYPPGPGYPGPSGFASEDDKTWAMVAHFGGAILAFISGGWLGWVAPLIALLARGSQSPTVRRHAAQALNFQLLWAVVALVITIVSTCLSIIVIGLFGFFLLIVPWIMGTVFGIVAGVKALNGEPYAYPASPNWVK
jgi:uncharacterized Tic20 family protein